MNSNLNTLPPLPYDYQPRPSYGKKVFLMGLICCALMFGVLAVWLMSYSRENTNESVAQEIAQKWGENVYITGPTIKQNLDSAAWQRPLTFDCNATVESKSLHRGIYEAEVFTSNVKMSGSFNRDSLALFGNSVVIELGVATKQIDKPTYLTIGGKKMEWSYSDHYLFANVNIADMPQLIEYSTEFNVRGSGALFIKQIGERSSVTINGEASNPSFNGESLPIDRNLRGRSFSASWEESVPAGVTFTDDFGFVGTRFLVGVDRYQKVSRSMKYSFIIILLTFISVLFVEIIKKHPIPLLNYFLIGAALIIFYSLLLSFTEIIPFGYAYLVASAMTVILITGYIWKMLDSRNLGLSIGAMLTIMYLFCYIMLCISTYALLIGSLLLFIALAALMYGSLKIKR